MTFAEIHSGSAAKAPLLLSPSVVGNGSSSNFHSHTRTPSLAESRSLSSPITPTSQTYTSCGSSYLDPSDALPDMLFKDSPSKRGTAGSSSPENSLLSRVPSIKSINTPTTSSPKGSPTKLKKRREFDDSAVIASGLLAQSSRAARQQPSFAEEIVRSPIPYDIQAGSPSVFNFSRNVQINGHADKADKDVFEDLNRTVRRRQVPMHPFLREDAPYMSSYSPAVLDNDYYTYEFLRHLNPHHSPSFQFYGKRAPTNVLDLGCGEGTWVVEAAKTWRAFGTKVTGFDLIDVHNIRDGNISPDADSEGTPKNVAWVRGNFVKYALPFADDTFDLVRMANLTLCIPHDRWIFILAEVRRVLKLDGRLELIDDELFFPPIPSLSETSASILRRSASQKHARTISEGSSSEHEPQLASKRRAAFPQKPSLAKSSSLLGHRSTGSRFGHCRTPSQAADYMENATISDYMETFFTNMLIGRYNIHPRPHEFLEHILAVIFGEDNKAQTHEFHLSLPPQDLFGRQGNDSRTVNGRPKPKKGDASPADSVAASLTRKTSQMLLGVKPTPFQPPGLFLRSTSSVIPFPPEELEMHVCKNMHVLLGCRNALTNFMLEHTDNDGVPIMSEKDFRDCLWDYERFRRKRFNFPDSYPGLQMLEDSPATSPLQSLLRFGANAQPNSGRERAVSIPVTHPLRPGGEGMTKVRVLRVYSAVKTHVSIVRVPF